MTDLAAAPRMAELHARLDDAQAYRPEYGPGYSNHLPMALEALHGLGADAARLRAYAAAYATRLSRRGGSPAERNGFEPLRAGYVERIGREGRAAVLRAVLPGLIEAAGAGLFHGMIRTAHAVTACHDLELASALAYWTSRESPARQGTAAVAPATADDISGVASRAAAAYVATANFVVLHVVTGSRAGWRLLPWFPDAGIAAGHIVAAADRALGALGANEGALGAEGAPASASTLPAWDALVAGALRSSDEHVVKLVHACRDLATEGDPGGHFRAAAARAVGGAG